MKMYSKDGMCMVDVRKVEPEGDNIAMTAKLMGAYSMKIYLRPEELREALKLLSWDLLACMPEMLIKGTQGEETLRSVGASLSAQTGKNLELLIGSGALERLRHAAKLIGIDSAKCLVENLLLILQVVLANKEPNAKK